MIGLRRLVPDRTSLWHAFAFAALSVALLTYQVVRSSERWASSHKNPTVEQQLVEVDGVTVGLSLCIVSSHPVKMAAVLTLNSPFDWGWVDYNAWPGQTLEDLASLYSEITTADITGVGLRHVTNSSALRFTYEIPSPSGDPSTPHMQCILINVLDDDRAFLTSTVLPMLTVFVIKDKKEMYDYLNSLYVTPYDMLFHSAEDVIDVARGKNAIYTHRTNSVLVAAAAAYEMRVSTSTFKKLGATKPASFVDLQTAFWAEVPTNDSQNPSPDTVLSSGSYAFVLGSSLRPDRYEVRTYGFTDFLSSVGGVLGIIVSAWAMLFPYKTVMPRRSRCACGSEEDGNDYVLHQSSAPINT